MAFIPKGSLLFSGFGDSVMQFRSPSGAKLVSPSSMPVAGAGNGGIATLDDGHICATGCINPFQAATGLGYCTFTSQLASPQGDAFGISLESCATNYLNKFYGTSNPAVGHQKLYVLNASGAKTAEYDMGVTFFPSAMIVGVAPDESAAYYAQKNGSTVYKRDLGGSTTSSFATNGSLQVRGNNSILVLRNGDVVVAWSLGGSSSGQICRYSSAGGLQQTYAAATTTVLTAGVDDTTFWANSYDAPSTSSGVRIYEFRTADAAIVNQFDPVDGSFEFDGPFTVLRASIGVPLQFTALANSKRPASAVRSAGRSLWRRARPVRLQRPGGVGWVSGYAGPYGSVPQHPDPVDGET
jgi:hypothetical protein